MENESVLGISNSELEGQQIVGVNANGSANTQQRMESARSLLPVDTAVSLTAALRPQVSIQKQAPDIGDLGTAHVFRRPPKTRAGGPQCTLGSIEVVEGEGGGQTP